MKPTILVFDSGVGGLSVVAEIIKKNPRLDIDYVFDRDFFPYGSKSESDLVPRVIQILTAAVAQTQPQAIVIACNTISTIALAQLRQQFKQPIIGVVPAIKPAATLSQTNAIIVLGTERTTRSHYIEKLIADHAGHCHVQLFPAQRLVVAAEKKVMGSTSYLDGVAKELTAITEVIKVNNCDVVVLACTHYPLLLAEISALLQEHIQVIYSGEAIANRVQVILAGISTATDTTLTLGRLRVKVVDSQRRTDIEPQRFSHLFSCPSSLSYLDITA